MRSSPSSFHQHERPHVPRSIGDSAIFFETAALAVAVARAARLERIVHVSSSEVYGTAVHDPMDESHPLQPYTPYAAAKCAAGWYLNRPEIQCNLLTGAERVSYTVTGLGVALGEGSCVPDSTAPAPASRRCRLPPLRRPLVVTILAAVIGVAPAVCAETRRGRLVVYQVDDFEGGRASTGYRLRVAGPDQPIELAFHSPPQFRRGDEIVVEGTTRQDGVFVVSRATAAGVTAPATAPAPPVGVQRTAVLLLDFRDATNVCGRAQAERLLFDDPSSVSRVYEEGSFGRVWFEGSAFGAFLIDDYRSQHCNPFGWAYQANLQAAAAGIDLRRFSRRLYLIATNPGWSCGWGGISEVGVTPSESIVEAYGGCGYPAVHAHELGHALGMHHASTDPQDDGVIDDEYGDYSDFMSGNYDSPGHTNAPHKLEMGWIAGADAPVITTNTRIGLRPLETLASAGLGVAAVRVVRPGTARTYFFSFRRRIGFDGGLGGEFADHVNVHSHGPSLGYRTGLIRTLAQSQTFQTPSFAVSYLSTSAAGAFVEVAFSCEAFRPLVEAPPPSLVRPGATAEIQVSIRNDDTVLCSSSGFGVQATGPDGWTLSAAPSRATIAPRAAATIRLAVTVPAETPDGEYPLEVRVRDAGSSAHDVDATVMVRVAACREDCATCRNGELDAGEECDDGNSSSGDGCDRNCTVTRCGNGVVTAGEQCDDGDTIDGDGCNATCERECASHAACDDDDPCDTDTCDAGLCRYAEVGGYEGAICVVGELTRTPVCGDSALPAKLRQKIDGTVPLIQALLRKAQDAVEPKVVGRLLKKADKKLKTIVAKTRKLVRRDQLDEGCGDAIVRLSERSRASVAGIP